tara:strand:- start:76 stop:1269 length:1194 start_codon:yes stop_codon:yes gene_type:complete
MSEKIINNITSKINNHFSQKYPLDFPKIRLNTDDLSLLVDKILTRGGVSILSLGKNEIRDKIENLIQILENKIKTNLELVNKKMTQEYQKLQYDKPNNYYNTNKGYEQDTTFKYEENLKKSIQNLEDKQTEIKYDMDKHSNFSIKDRYYPEEMNYEKKTTKKVKIKINSKDRKVSAYSSPSNITFSFSKNIPLLIPILPKNISNEELVLDTELDSGLDRELDKTIELDKTTELNKNNLCFIDKIKYNNSIQDLEINIDKLIGNSIIPINLNQVISLKILNVILFDKYMVSKRPVPYLLLQIPELTKEITSMDNSQILGGDNNILNSIMCLDDYRVMNGYRYYTNMEFEGIRFETPKNIDKLTFQLLTPTGEEVKMSSKMENTPETVVQYSLELEVEV